MPLDRATASHKFSQIHIDFACNIYYYGELTVLITFCVQLIRIKVQLISKKGPDTEFTNDLRETLYYGELLKHEFYLILRNFGWANYSNNFIKCLHNKARCILIYYLLEMGKICVSIVHRKIMSPVNSLRIRLLECNFT